MKFIFPYLESLKNLSVEVIFLKKIKSWINSKIIQCDFHLFIWNAIPATLHKRRSLQKIISRFTFSASLPKWRQTFILVSWPNHLETLIMTTFSRLIVSNFWDEKQKNIDESCDVTIQSRLHSMFSKNCLHDSLCIYFCSTQTPITSRNTTKLAAFCLQHELFTRNKFFSEKNLKLRWWWWMLGSHELSHGGAVVSVDILLRS